MELMQAHHQWANRPNDERFLSLTDLHAHNEHIRANSYQTVVPSRSLHAEPVGDDHKGLTIVVRDRPYAPTNWSFGQLATLAEAPAAYLRKLPSELATDNVNYGLMRLRQIEDVGVLVYRNGGAPTLNAATGPKYGRIWNSAISGAMVEKFGDGVTGQFKIPGEFGIQGKPITKENTTLYAGTEDMFVFLADETNRITLPNRRNGRSGSLARGFFCWNSEVGKSRFGFQRFYYDYMCGNHIVWGAEGVETLNIRHTSGAPERFFQEIGPALRAYVNRSEAEDEVKAAIEDARSKVLGDELDTFLKTRFSKPQVAAMVAVHELEEQRPMETRWDVVVAATAVARGYGNIDDRVSLERQAGKILTIDGKAC